MYTDIIKTLNTFCNCHDKTEQTDDILHASIYLDYILLFMCTVRATNNYSSTEVNGCTRISRRMHFYSPIIL